MFLKHETDQLSTSILIRNDLSEKKLNWQIKNLEAFKFMCPPELEQSSIFVEMKSVEEPQKRFKNSDNISFVGKIKNWRTHSQSFGG